MRVARITAHLCRRQILQQRYSSTLEVATNALASTTGSALVKPLHAVISTFDLFSIGIGPSSSHTVGPLRAAKIFCESLRKHDLLSQVSTLKIALYGSLAATGKGHLSPQALMMGMEGESAEDILTETVEPRYEAIKTSKTLILGGTRKIDFDLGRDMIWHYNKSLEQHPNGMTFSVYDNSGSLIAHNTYLSIGGGFVISLADQEAGANLYYKSIDKDEASASRRAPAGEAPPIHTAINDRPSNDPVANNTSSASASEPPFPFHNGDSLLELCRQNNLTIAQLVWENEKHYLSDAEIRAKLFKLYSVMDECIHAGITSTEEVLPGSLKLKRRARHLYKRLSRGLYTQPPNESFAASLDSNQKAVVSLHGKIDHILPPIRPKRAAFVTLDILSCYAIAVNEQNAAGGRVVTAPTNGAAGIIPSVLKYFLEYISDDQERDLQTFLLTAAAIGMLFKRGATISAAEGGCMAEVGVACAMASGAFAACLGASPEIIETAAEIAIEHNLGLTCDPIDGLVQAPCIERNALGACKAVTAANLALAGLGRGSISLDQAIAAMRQTASLMTDDLKETSRGGLAKYATSVRVPECKPRFVLPRPKLMITG